MSDFKAVHGSANPLLSNARVPLLGFAAFSGTGKTTLLKQVIPRLVAEGLRVGLIKHAHHAFDVDHPGKDSHELRMAGASPVMLSSSHRRAVMTEHAQPADPVLNHELAFLDQSGIDLLLVEGFKKARFPKVELHRPALGKPLLYPEDDAIIALATDEPLAVPPSVPCLDLNDIDQMVSFIVSWFAAERLGSEHE